MKLKSEQMVPESAGTLDRCPDCLTRIGDVHAPIIRQRVDNVQSTAVTVVASVRQPCRSFTTAIEDLQAQRAMDDADGENPGGCVEDRI